MDLNRAISELRSDRQDVEPAILAIELFARLGTHVAAAAARILTKRTKKSHSRMVSGLRSLGEARGLGLELKYIDEAIAALERLDRRQREQHVERVICVCRSRTVPPSLCCDDQPPEKTNDGKNRISSRSE
jgi:hypothetical protein